MNDATDFISRSKEAVIGIPDRENFGDPTKIPVGKLLPFVRQLHQAERAGTHYDVRFGDDNLYSWATRHELPGPGEKRLLFQQPLHSPQYANFEGKIPSGYGAGQVSKAEEGKVIVTKATPDKISLIVAHKKYPEYYTLLRGDGPNRPWLMVNTTPMDPNRFLGSSTAYSKVRIKSIPAASAQTAIQGMVEGKVDGASALFKLNQDSVDVVSYRVSRTGRPIIHTQRFFGEQAPKIDVPPAWQGKILRGEIFAEKDGKPLKPQALTPVLNSSVSNSLERQKAQGINLRAALFGIADEDLNSPDRSTRLNEALSFLPSDKFTRPPSAQGHEEGMKLWNDIAAGQHPHVHEGVVVYPEQGQPMKVKLRPESDVTIRNVFPGEGKYKDSAGGFDYSLPDSDKVVGRVGTGFDDNFRQWMWDNRNDVSGRAARIEASQQLPSGAYFQPSFVSFHEDLPLGAPPVEPMNKSASDQLTQLRTAKNESDRGNYSEKTRILRNLMLAAPDEWFVDSNEGHVVGVTHIPTQWRYHLPRQNVPPAILGTMMPKAADFISIPEDPMDFLKFGLQRALPGPVTPGFVPVMKNGRMTMGDAEEADYEIPSPAHQFTDTTNLVPMVSTMKGARTFIASKYFVQALPLESPEGPLIDTVDDETGQSWSKKIGRKIGATLAPGDGTVKTVGKGYLELTGADGSSHRIDLKSHFPHNRKTYRTDRPIVQAGQKVKTGDVLAASNYTDDEGRLALGKNLNVAFMPSPGGAGFEDAIVVSQRAADALTSQHMYGYDVDHRHGTVSDKKRFVSLFPNRYTNDQLDKISDNGMVKPGAVLAHGDPIFLSIAPRTLSSRDAAVGNLHKVLRNSFQDLSQTWDKATQGVVAHAKENRTGLATNIVTSMPLQSGDKVSARQGAKGVISKIVPNDQMYRGADGDHMDVLINPAALIGRVNPGMVLESLLGKIAHRTGKKYRLPAFAQESFRDYTEHELNAHNIPDREDLIDPTTGKTVPGVLNGRQYFMKLEHTAESKLSGRGEGGSDLNDQPSKGGDEGAKRLGGLQMLALVSHGATEVLRDAHLYRGSKNPELWRRLQAGESLPAPGVPFVYDKFMASLRAAGINTHKKGDHIHMMALTDKDIDSFAHHELQNGETVNVKSGEPVKGGLMDYGLHGGPEGRGWSYIALDHPIPNPVMEDPVRRILGLTEKDMREVIAGRQDYNGKRGPAAIHEALQKVNLDDAEEDAKTTIRLGRKTKRDDAVRKLNFINGLKKAGLRPEEMMISKVPVLPPTFRPVSLMGNMMLTADANYLYRDLMTARNAYRANRTDLPEEDLGDDRLAIYDAVKAVAGLGDPIHQETQDKGVKGLIRQMAGVGGPKTGFFQSKVIGHPVNAVGRSVIIPDSDLDMDQVGVPEEMAWRMFGPFAMRRMVRAGMPAVQAAQSVERQTTSAKKFLLEEMGERPVLYSRDPALHRFSIMGAMPKIVTGDSIRLSPLVVKPFNADFDGDQMNVHVVVSDEARDEVKKKMMPSKNLFSLKGRDVHYTPSQEFILGLFNSTNLKNGKTTMKFPNIEAAMAAYKASGGKIPIDQPIEIA